MNAQGDKVTIGVFDKVEVEISVEKVRPRSLSSHSLDRTDACTRVPALQDRNTQRGKVVMHLIDPVDSRGP